MHHQPNELDPTVQIRQQRISKVVTDLLLPSDLIGTLCKEVGHTYSERIYTPSVVIWLFVMQVLSRDHRHATAQHQFHRRDASHRRVRGKPALHEPRQATTLAATVGIDRTDSSRAPAGAD